MLGVDVGGTQPSEYEKLTHVLTSDRLAEVLEKRRGLIHKLIPGWSDDGGRWAPPRSLPEKIKYWLGRAMGKPAWRPPASPEMATGLARYLTVEPMNERSGLGGGAGPMRLVVQSGDRNQAGDLLQYVLADSDDIVRQDKASTSGNRVRYLTGQLNNTTDLMLRQNLQNLLLHEQQTLMILNTDKYYSFDLIDPTAVATTPVSPKSLTVLLYGLLAGMILGCGYAVRCCYRALMQAWNLKIF